MCFAPQRRTLFRHLNFQKWSGAGVFCTFWLGHVLRATTTAFFSDISTSKSGPTLAWFLCICVFCTFWLGNVLRTACNSSSLIWPHGSAPAALASLLFDPPEPQTIGKNTVFCDFPTVLRTCILLSSHSFSSLIFSLQLFYSLTLPNLCFSICPYCRKFDF